jgi:hypothetical protein
VRAGVDRRRNYKDRKYPHYASVSAYTDSRTS